MTRHRMRLIAVLTAAAAAVPVAAATPAAAATPTRAAVPVTGVPLCPVATPHHSRCASEVLANAARQPVTTPTIKGLGPADLRSAYGLPGGSVGAGATVAIVDAYDLPTAASDLATYRAAFGLPPMTGTGVTAPVGSPAFAKVDQAGAPSPLPAADAGWGAEIALDLEMVSATCPSCNIVLLEADTNADADLAATVDTAATVPSVAAISNSYGGPDPSAPASYDHPGIAITASTGDDGYGVSYPAAFPTVTAVGGTSLRRSANARGWSETAWSGAGSGCSTSSDRPAFQTGVVTGCTGRAVADVSAVADPRTGVAVYDTTAIDGRTGWFVFGGTSVSSPIIAAVFALAGGTDPGLPYRRPAALNDVTSGSNGRCAVRVLCAAGPGWDGPTGLGTPHGLVAFTPGCGSDAVRAALEPRC